MHLKKHKTDVLNLLNYSMRKLLFIFLLFPILVIAQNWEQIIIYPGASASNPMFFTEFNGELYFQARGEFIGAELFKTNGTTTTLVQDINNVNADYGYPENFKVFNNELYFIATHPTYGRELFKINGGVTSLVKDINAGASNSQTFYEENQMAMIEHNGFLYFFSNDSQSYFNDWDLWKTDGTENGTTKVLDFNTAEINGFKKNFLLIDGKFYFMKKIGITTYLYQYNPANDSLINLAQLAGDIEYLTEFEGKLFFKTNKIYYTDGTLNNQGAYINSITGTDNLGHEMIALGDNLIFASNNRLYKCYYHQGSQDYVVEILYAFSGTMDSFYNNISNDGKNIFYKLNNKLYFAAREDSSPSTNNGGKIIQIYSTDGTTTEVVIPINNFEFESYQGNWIQDMLIHENQLYFMMYDPASFSYYFWQANLTTGSYQQLNSPSISGSPEKIAAEHLKPFNPIIVYSNSIYLGGYTSSEEKELWRFGTATLGVDEVTFEDKIKIYPNPTQDYVKLTIENIEAYQIAIFNAVGQEIKLRINNKSIDFTSVPEGIYYITISNSTTDKKITQKIIKK